MGAEVISLGCRLNLSESEELRGCFHRKAIWW
jgi:tRNA A37 methylthiotransferase MiaB